jgi:hypothetical protein
MSIWVIVIFVILTIVGLVMVGIGLHEKTKHKDNPAGKPGKTYDILLYAGIAIAVIGIIGLVWSMISYAKSKKKTQVVTGPQGQYGNDMMGFQDTGYSGQDYGIEMTTMSQAPPVAPVAPVAPQFIPLPDGRFYNNTTGVIIPASQPSQPSQPFMISQPSSSNTENFNFKDFINSIQALKLIKEASKNI